MSTGARPFARGLALLIGSALLLLLALDQWLPPPIRDIDRDGAVVVTAADGSVLRALADQRGVWRYPVDIDEVDPIYLQALLGYEDRHFYAHPGVNPLALLRALTQALWHGRPVSGGSTLTMQVARLMEGIPHTATGKLWQIGRAVQLEMRLTKAQILALYLNYAPFGGTREGVAAASLHYYGRHPRTLSAAEAALLAVLPQAPSRLRPDRHPERARAARDKVLRRLAAFGVIDAAGLEAALAEPIALSLRPAPTHAALLAEHLKRARPNHALLRSSIDGRLQFALEDRLPRYLGRFAPGTSGAILIADARTGKVVAEVGSARFADARSHGHVDMVRAPRSPGSTLKPLIYGLALDAGLIHSHSLLSDAPMDIDGYRPGNFDGRYRGPVSATAALVASLNLPAVDLLDRVGAERFDAKLKHAGTPLRLPAGAKPNLAVALGGAALTLDDLVTLYSALARDGSAIGLSRLADEAPAPARRVLSSEAAYIVGQMLRERDIEGLPGAVLNDPVRRSMVVKTGTSYGFRDTWAIGTIGHYALGVWIGRPDGSPMPGEYGAISALPLFEDIGRHLGRRENLNPPPKPAGVIAKTICWPLGMAPRAANDPLCEYRFEALTIGGATPPTLAERAPQHVLGNPLIVAVDQGTGERVAPTCHRGPTIKREIARWPSLVEPWLPRSQRLASRLPQASSACRTQLAVLGNEQLRIVGVRDGQVLRPPPQDPLRTMQIEVRADGATGVVVWLKDDVRVAQTPADNAVTLTLTLARHSLTALDSAGRYARIEVGVERDG